MKKIFVVILFVTMAMGCTKEDDSDTPTYPRIVVSSPSFSIGAALDGRFADTRNSDCSGDNDFPGLTWEPGPASTVEYVVIVEDFHMLKKVTSPTSTQKFVLLNAYGIAHTSATSYSIPVLTAAANVVTFPAGITVGQNGWDDDTTVAQPRTTGWAGPCPTNAATYSHRIMFWVYALDASPGAINKMDHTAFELANSANIVGAGYTYGVYP